MPNKKLNPDLFKDEPLPALEAESYYAYLDSVEQVNSEIFLKFDCISVDKVNKIQVTKESIFDFPSIKIEISGDKETIRNLVGYSNIYLLESSWMLISTNTKKSKTTVEQYFNFQIVNKNNSANDYGVEKVTLFRDLSDEFKKKIKEIITATTIAESSEEDVYKFLNEIDLNHFNHINVYNVGQGNCTALVTNHNNPLIYFDVGGGCNACTGTYPSGFTLCHTNFIPVILSHWDEDHIISACFDPNLLNHKWLAPVQGNLSNTAMHIAQFLINNGKLVSWNNNIPYIDFSGHRIVKCNGLPRNKNNSGLALFVRYSEGQYVVLPGDATYTRIVNRPAGSLIGLVASHHGSRGSIGGMPNATNPGMIAYSAGNQRRPLDPNPVAVASYNRRGWNSELRTINGNIAMMNHAIPMIVPCGVKCTLAPVQHF